MAPLDVFRRLFTPKPPATSYDLTLWPTSIERVTFNGRDVDAGEFGMTGWVSLDDMSPAEMWRTQPHLRTVVSFLARNIAQLGLQSFERVDENDRRRDRTSTVARLMARPNATTSQYELVFGLVVDALLYDAAFVAVMADATAPSGWSLWRLPPAWVTPKADSIFSFSSYEVRAPGAGTVTFDASEVWSLHGYHPTDPRRGSPTIQALKGTLEEQISASKARIKTWQRGGKVSSVLTRPTNAPRWTDAQRDRFRADWYAKYSGDGSEVGGTPILEDGMTLSKMDFSAAEQQFVEAAKLSFATVASAFHVNPTMVGLLDNANFSNVREFRRMLYGDTLGPLMAQIEDRMNTFLLPMLRVDNARTYLEFNIAEKLQGNFEEQTTALQSSVGRPWMTANEARARMNLPALEGDADELITPLNVTIGGQASPRDSAPNKP